MERWCATGKRLPEILESLSNGLLVVLQTESDQIGIFQPSGWFGGFKTVDLSDESEAKSPTWAETVDLLATHLRLDMESPYGEAKDIFVQSAICRLLHRSEPDQFPPSVTTIEIAVWDLLWRLGRRHPIYGFNFAQRHLEFHDILPPEAICHGNVI